MSAVAQAIMAQNGRESASVAAPVLAGPRIGISRATELPYRFFLDATREVTRSPQNRAAHPLKR